MQSDLEKVSQYILDTLEHRLREGFVSSDKVYIEALFSVVSTASPHLSEEKFYPLHVRYTTLRTKFLEMEAKAKSQFTRMANIENKRQERIDELKELYGDDWDMYA